MKQVFNIQVQRAENGFIAIAQNDEPGIRSKKLVATTEDDIKKMLKDCVDHMFDPAPVKEKAEPEKPAA